MVYDGAEFSLENLFHQLKKQVEEENIKSYEEYKDLIDSLIEEKQSYGFFADEEDLIQIKHDLELRWPEIEAKKILKK